MGHLWGRKLGSQSAPYTSRDSPVSLVLNHYRKINTTGAPSGIFLQMYNKADVICACIRQHWCMMKL